MPANGRWPMGQRDHGVMSNAPLAERMRPKRLEGIVGQPHILGPNGALTPMLSMGRLPSLLLWGPPGVGKTSLVHQYLHKKVRLSFIDIKLHLVNHNSQHFNCTCIYIFPQHEG